MAKNGWIRENRKDKNGVIRLMDVLYVNGKIKNKHIVEKSGIQTQVTDIKQPLKSIVDKYKNYSTSDKSIPAYTGYGNAEVREIQSGNISYIENMAIPRVYPFLGEKDTYKYGIKVGNAIENDIRDKIVKDIENTFKNNNIRMSVVTGSSWNFYGLEE